METIGRVGDLDHCRGTLVLHQDGAAECTEPGCAHLDAARHPMTDGCDVLLGGCACVDVEVTVELRAS